METKSILIERVESNKINKAAKIIGVCSVLLLLLGMVKVLFLYNKYHFNRIGYWIDTVWLCFLAPILGVTYCQNKLNNRKGQFIEWWSDKIVYKTKNEKEITIILKSNISRYKISVDLIEITNNDQSIKILDISDFSDYQARLKIKESFKSY